MEGLLQVFSASVAIYNLPLTVLLIGVLGYWLLVGVGLFDLHSVEGGGGGVHADAGDLHHGADGHGPGHEVGALQSLLGILGAGQVPVMVVLTLLIVCMWAIALLANHYLNAAGSGLVALGLFVPNAILSLVATRLLVSPLRPIFAAMNKDYDQALPVVGQICKITTGQVTDAYGQATIETRGAPITINVRLSTGEPLVRGDQALVIEEDRAKQLYKVVKYEQPKLEI